MIGLSDDPVNSCNLHREGSVFRLERSVLSWTVEDDVLRSRSKNSPFEHRTLEGRAVETVVAGETVYTYPRKA